MKKILLLVFTFFLFVLARQTTAHVHAQETAVSVTPQEQASPTPTPVKYTLAYPGMLPDSKLYKLKQLRDKIEEFLISDPTKKIQFYLLQTDKGIAAVAMLVDRNEIPLAETTALKAENNYTLLTYKLNYLHQKPDADFFNKLHDASLKHQEVLSDIIKKVPAKDAKVFQTVLDFSKRNWNTVEEFQKNRVVAQ